MVSEAVKPLCQHIFAVPCCAMVTCRSLQQQLHVLYELHQLHIPVLLSDIRTIWLQDAVPFVRQTAAAAAGLEKAAAGGCDVAASPNVLLVDVSAATGTPAGHQQLLKQLAAAQAASKLGG